MPRSVLPLLPGGASQQQANNLPNATAVQQQVLSQAASAKTEDGNGQTNIPNKDIIIDGQQPGIQQQPANNGGIATDP